MRWGDLDEVHVACRIQAEAAYGDIKGKEEDAEAIADLVECSREFGDHGHGATDEAQN